MRVANYFPLDPKTLPAPRRTSEMHLCEQPMNLTRRACCQLVLLLNDTTRVPPCTADFLSAEYNESRRYSPPAWLDEPPEIAEDHATFILGILILVLIAAACTFTLNKLTKPKIAIGYGSGSSYDFMMWMPTGRSQRRWSMLVLLREFTCRRAPSNRNSDISVVSSHIGLLPSYQSATTTPSSQIPPPPYSETRRLTTPEMFFRVLLLLAVSAVFVMANPPPPPGGGGHPPPPGGNPPPPPPSGTGPPPPPPSGSPPPPPPGGSSPPPPPGGQPPPGK